MSEIILGRVWSRPLLYIAALGMVGGCVSTISGKANSGKDYRSKGAKKLQMKGDEVRAKGIVTYPGGDRVDWVSFDIPKGKKGVMKVKLSWRAPRPGLDLAFNVYDQYYHRVARAKPTRRPDRTKRAKVKNVEGKYYVQIYAPTRMDAGTYRLTVTFREVIPVDLNRVKPQLGAIPPPPTLPAVPQPAGPVVTPPVVTPPVVGPPVVGPVVPPPVVKPPVSTPVRGLVRRSQVTSGGFSIITINKGKKKGVERGWKGSILRGPNAGPLQGGDFTVIKVTELECVAKVRLGADRIRKHRHVLLTPP